MAMDLFQAWKNDFHALIKLKEFCYLNSVSDRNVLNVLLFQADNFPFLGDYSSECLKTRQLFYQSLGRILLVDLGEDEEKFIEFMRPLTS